MGTEAYYIFVAAGNREIKADNLSSLNGKRIGVNKDSIQEGFLRDWANKHGIQLKIVPMTTSEDESMEKIVRNEIDGYATIFTFDYNNDVMPVCRIGGSDYYYAVNKNRSDLLEELNAAMAEIQDEDPYFNERISRERLYSSKTTALLTPTLEDYIAEHGEIRIGYRNNYLPFCGTDEKGELTGALKDFLAHAQNKLNSDQLKFKAIPYDSAEETQRLYDIGFDDTEDLS